MTDDEPIRIIEEPTGRWRLTADGWQREYRQRVVELWWLTQ